MFWENAPRTVIVVTDNVTQFQNLLLVCFLPVRSYASVVFAIKRCLSICLSHAGIVSKWLNLS